MTRLSRRGFLWLAALVVPASRSVAASRAASLDDFMVLCERLLGRAGLDRDVGRIYLDALNADPDQAPTLAYLIEVNNNPTPEMKALSATIVEWWYTGVYQVKGEDRLATHAGALVWSAMEMPAPGTCAGAFGAWSSPPA